MCRLQIIFFKLQIIELIRLISHHYRICSFGQTDLTVSGCEDTLASLAIVIKIAGLLRGKYSHDRSVINTNFLFLFAAIIICSAIFYLIRILRNFSSKLTKR